MYDRHGCLAAVNGALPPKSRQLFHALFGMLTVLMILATVAAIFMAIAAVSQGVRKSPDLNEFALVCSFLALWGFVTCYQIGIMVWAHKQALRANKYDKVRACPKSHSTPLLWMLTTLLSFQITQSIAKVIAPVSALGMVFGIAFTIIPLLFIGDFFTYTLFAIITGMMIYWGRKPGLWDAEGTFAPLTPSTRL